MAIPGSAEHPLLVAIVGSGPSGFYAAEALIKSDVNVKVDILERLPSPYGLVRSGVAPDHQKLKQAIKLYEKIAEEEGFNLIANVNVGTDVTIDDLKRSHHAVIIACGAETDRALGIPGETLPGSYTATEFVGWYNGHPDYRDHTFDLSGDTAVIIGQGNVAADVARILSKTVDELKHTDIAEHALAVLAESKIREVYVIGRRGPAQAKFTPKELREFGELADCQPVVATEELVLNPESQQELSEKTNVGSKKVYDLFNDFAQLADDPGKSRRCLFRFLLSPVELVGDDQLQQVLLEKNSLSGDAFQQSARGTGENVTIDTGILFRSIGYRGVPIAGVPFNESRGTIPNEGGRVTENDRVVEQLYTAGWIKRGPSGIIGTNRACSVETVGCLLEDLEKLAVDGVKGGASELYALLEENNIRSVSYSDWKKIDQEEIARGASSDKPREKFTRKKEMLDLLTD